VIKVTIEASSVQQVQQRLQNLPPELVAEVHKALKPLIYQSLRSGVPKYFTGTGGSGSNLLASRSGNLLNSVLQSIQATSDGRDLVVSIGSNLPYAAIHEYGGYAGRRGPFRKKDGKRPYLRPRPYLHPAMRDLEQVLPALVEQALQQAQVAL